jgi:hypothetical protein
MLGQPERSLIRIITQKGCLVILYCFYVWNMILLQNMFRTFLSAMIMADHSELQRRWKKAATRQLPGMIIELAGLMAQGKMTTSVSPKLRV